MYQVFWVCVVEATKRVVICSTGLLDWPDGDEMRFGSGMVSLVIFFCTKKIDDVIMK